MASKHKLVLVSDLKPSPANRELYDDFDANDPKMQKLVEQMKLHYQQTKKNGNYEDIVIDKNTYIRSGDRRTFASKLAGTGISASAAVLSVDAAQSGITSLGTLTGLTLDGDKNVTPGDGAMIHLDTSTITDNNIVMFSHI